jgi:hypothetical protein
VAKLTALGYFGIAKETTYGTAVAPSLFIPYDSIKVEDDLRKSTDEGRRGVLSKEFAVYNTTRLSKIDLETLAYPDTIGHFLLGILGKDTVTGVAVPYTHKFQILDGAASSYTLADYNVIAGTNERRYPGGVIDEVGFKFDDDGNMKVSTKFQSKISTLVAKSTPTQNVLTPFQGWMSNLTLGGVTNADILGGEVSIKRQNELLFAGNATQDPTRAINGRIEISGKLTFDVNDESEYLTFLNGTQQSIQVAFTVSANQSLTFLFTKTDVTKATVDRGSEYVRVDLEFKALYNTTDAGLCQITLINSVATY